MMLLKNDIKKYTGGYKFIDSLEIVTYLMYMEDKMIFTKNEEDLKKMFYKLEFEIENCAMLMMKK